MSEFELIVPCHFGMESVLKNEIYDIGYEITEVSDGRVTFLGDEEAIARANVFLRTGERVLLKVGSFHAETYEELNKTLPHPGDEVESADGLNGLVESVNILRQTARIIVEVDDEKELHEYNVSDLTILRRRRRGASRPTMQKNNPSGARRKDGKESRESREGREGKESRENRDGREAREGRDGKEKRERREGRKNAAEGAAQDREDLKAAGREPEEGKAGGRDREDQKTAGRESGGRDRGRRDRGRNRGDRRQDRRGHNSRREEGAAQSENAPRREEGAAQSGNAPHREERPGQTAGSPADNSSAE